VGHVELQGQLLGKQLRDWLALTWE
jgi:hypothetical protein